MLKIPRAKKIDLYDMVITSHPDAIRKGDTMPCTTLNGNMYSYFTKDDYVALRLPEAERLKFIEQYQTTLVRQYGIVQKEYVRVTDGLLKNTEEFKYWFGLSYTYASSLKPKPSAKSKK